MPSGVFKTLRRGLHRLSWYFTRTNSGGTDDVWFYDMQADGYSLDDKRTPQPEPRVTLPTFSPVGVTVRPSASGRGLTRVSLVPKAEIASNGYDLSINRYKEVEYEAVEHDPPKMILARLAALEDETRSRTHGIEQVAPMRWHAHEIGEVAQVNPRLAAVDRPDPNDKVSFVPMASVSEETMSIAVHEERPFSEVSKGYTPFMRGDVLVAKITPCFENGKMALADNLPHELGFGTTEFHVFRPSERVTGPYLFNILRVPWFRNCGSDEDEGGCRSAQGSCRLYRFGRNPRSTHCRAKADCEDSGCGGRLTGQASRGARPTRHRSSNPPSSKCSGILLPILWGGNSSALSARSVK